MVRERKISRNTRTSVPNPNKPSINCLGVSSTKLREMGGALGMQASRAARKMTARTASQQQSQDADDDTFYIDDVPAPTPRARKTVDVTPARGTGANTRRSIFNRRPNTTPAQSTNSRAPPKTMLQRERGQVAPPSKALSREDWVTAMEAVDKQKAKIEMLTHRIDGLSEQLQKRSAGDPADLEDMQNDMDEIVEKLEEHGQLMEEMQEIVELVRGMDSQVREMFDATHFFYGVTTQDTPCCMEPSFESQTEGYIGKEERVMLVHPQQAGDDGTVWIKARRISAEDGTINEYWVPMATEDSDYFTDFQL